MNTQFPAFFLICIFSLPVGGCLAPGIREVLLTLMALLIFPLHTTACPGHACPPTLGLSTSESLGEAKIWGLLFSFTDQRMPVPQTVSNSRPPSHLQTPECGQRGQKDWREERRARELDVLRAGVVLAAGGKGLTRPPLQPQVIQLDHMPPCASCCSHLIAKCLST